MNFTYGQVPDLLLLLQISSSSSNDRLSKNSFGVLVMYALLEVFLLCKQANLNSNLSASLHWCKVDRSTSEPTHREAILRGYRELSTKNDTHTHTHDVIAIT